MPPAKQPPKQPNAEASPEYQLTLKLLAAFQATWKAEYEGRAGVDPVLFSRLSLVALTQLGALIAVDIGATPEQFNSICAAQYTEAHKHAPKFS